MDPKPNKLLTCSALALLIGMAPLQLDWTADGGMKVGIAKLSADDDDDDDRDDDDNDDRDDDDDDDRDDDDDDDDDRDDDDNDDRDDDDDDDRNDDDDDDRDDDDDDIYEQRAVDYLSTDEEADLISRGWE